MVAKGSYTPASGPLAGTTFPSYYRYQNARAQAQGFTSYRQQRVETGIGNRLAAVMINSAVSRRGWSRERARNEVREWFKSQPKGPSQPTLGGGTVGSYPSLGARKHDAIIWLKQNNIYAESERGDYEDIPY